MIFRDMKNTANNKPYRIAQIIRKVGDGGIESVVYNYYKAMDHDTFRFDVFYHSDSMFQPPQDMRDMGMRFIEIPPYQKDLLGYIRALRKYFKENEYIIVHSNMNTISVFSLYAAWRERIPIRILHNHNVPGGDEHLRNTLKYILRPFGSIFATDLFACSGKAARWMYGKKCDKGLVKVLPNAIDFDRYSSFSEKEVLELKKKLGIENKIVIGHVGRYTYAKNHAFLLEITRELVKRNNDYVLLLVGDGELRDDINSQIKKYGLEKNVVQAGWINNPELYYSAMNVFVFPSRYEGLGMAVIEAQACKLPCLVSDAVPDEAKISQIYHTMDIGESPEVWADKVTEVSLMKNELLPASHNYDITACAADLSQYYLNRIDAYYGKK